MTYELVLKNVYEFARQRKQNIWVEWKGKWQDMWLWKKPGMFSVAGTRRWGRGGGAVSDCWTHYDTGTLTIRAFSPRVRERH